MVVCGTLSVLRDVAFGAPLHSLVLVGKVTPSLNPNRYHYHLPFLYPDPDPHLAPLSAAGFKVGADEEELLAAFATEASKAARLDRSAAKAEDAATARANAAHAGERYISEEEEEVEAEEEEEVFDLAKAKADDSVELKLKQEAERKKAEEATKADAERIAKMQELEGQGKRVSGGMHKFDASEVDVHGGDATADDFMDAFGF